MTAHFYKASTTKHLCIEGFAWQLATREKPGMSVLSRLGKTSAMTNFAASMPKRGVTPTTTHTPGQPPAPYSQLAAMGHPADRQDPDHQRPAQARHPALKRQPRGCIVSHLGRHISIADPWPDPAANTTGRQYPKIAHRDTCAARPDEAVQDPQTPRTLKNLKALPPDDQESVYLLMAHDSAVCGNSMLPRIVRDSPLLQAAQLGFRQPYIGIRTPDGQTHELIGEPGQSLTVLLLPAEGT